MYGFYRAHDLLCTHSTHSFEFVLSCIMTLHHVIDVRTVAEEGAACLFRVDLEVQAVCSSETL
jgi:hypothetical protein